ncbi:hypothetical protein [Paenibacillus naphthalenovorans]|uniref:hypothetical protein n=1 Tax=Paenibacillus naphthalenovorans TaxID=162209 RepID=UPI003D2C7381
MKEWRKWIALVTTRPIRRPSPSARNAAAIFGVATRSTGLTTEADSSMAANVRMTTR